jgi:hypothetical protein
MSLSSKLVDKGGTGISGLRSLRRLGGDGSVDEFGGRFFPWEGLDGFWDRVMVNTIP